MPQKNSSRNHTLAERKQSRRYLLEIAGGAVLFMVFFLALPLWINPPEGTASAIIVALIPFLPVCWMAVAAIGHLQRVDEFQRMVLLQSFSIGFASAMLTAIAIALLEPAGVVVSGAQWWVFLSGMLMWGGSGAILTLRAHR